jgi:Bax protein
VLLRSEPDRRFAEQRAAKPVAATTAQLGAQAEPGAQAAIAAGEAAGPAGDYDLDAVAAGAPVPRLIATMARDAPPQALGDARRAFVRDLLPLVLLVNEEVLAERARLWDIRVKRDLGQPLSALDRLWLVVEAERYRCGPDDVDELTRRIDAVPPSLILAAAAAASDWGRGEPARSRAALFGIALPANPTAVGRARTAVGYESPVDAVRAYLHALNVEPGLATFRSERAELRRRGDPLGGAPLAPFLGSTGAVGAAGGRLRAMIEAERLDRFDAARLAPATRPSGTAGGGARPPAGLL